MKLPLCFSSIERGLSNESGGARYNDIEPNMLGMTNVIESFNVVKELVFNQQKLTVEEFNEILKNNYVGSEDILAYIKNKVSHFGTDTKETNSLAKRVADTLTGGEVIILSGDLGAGKTTFTKGLAKALGVESEVTSPTFTIMNVYEEGRLKLNHLDMYRIEHEDDLYELGVEDAIGGDTVTVIEWNKLTSLGDKVIYIDVTVDKKNRKFNVRYENTCS